MNYASQLDLDLSALPLDDFEVTGQELTVESLTAGQTMGGHCHPCGTCGCTCNCMCPCTCNGCFAALPI
jgi:hypothetical protein